MVMPEKPLSARTPEFIGSVWASSHRQQEMDHMIRWSFEKFHLEDLEQF